MRHHLPTLLGLLAAAAALGPLAAEASDPFLTVLPPDDLAAATEQRYARMTREEAVAELKGRGAIFDEVPAEKAPGVVAPIRLTSRLNGVHFHGMLGPEASTTTPFEILDARLGLSLYDFAGILTKHGVNEVVHFSMYRPGAPARPAPNPAAAPAGRPRMTAARPGPAGRRPPLGAVLPDLPSEGQTTSRHPAGLAIDVAVLKKATGERLSVASQFGGRVGQQTCGAGAKAPAASEGRELHEIVCEAADARLFTYVLTPDYNRAHHDHFHMEIKSGVRWVLVH